MNVVNYRPYGERTPDRQYGFLLQHIRDNGIEVGTQLDERARRIFGHMLRFDLRNGFPLTTERDLLTGPRGGFEQAVGELLAFLHGEHTLAGLERWGCYYWKRWGTEAKCKKRGLETGDLGPGSYGAAWASFPTASGGSFDQIAHLIEQIREMPHLRTHLVTPFVPQYLGRGQGKVQKVVVVPCHGLFHVLADPETRKLCLYHHQRSADVPVGLVFNLVHYALLTMMIAQVTGYEATEYVHAIVDAHFYVKQLPDVEALLDTKPQPFPTVTLDPSVTELRDFRFEHFKVEDYHPVLPRRTIWTPV